MADGQHLESVIGEALRSEARHGFLAGGGRTVVEAPKQKLGLNVA